jgi:Ca2+-binding RTX toxin-like protein
MRRRPRRPQRGPLRKLWVILPLIALNMFIVFTATNTVPATLLDNEIAAITANDVKPPGCGGINLSAVLGGPGLVTGTGADELLLGSELPDNMSGAGGSDCLVGGPGGDTLNGGTGTDVCLGGDGIDTFVSCETAVQ